MRWIFFYLFFGLWVLPQASLSQYLWGEKNYYPLSKIPIQEFDTLNTEGLYAGILAALDDSSVSVRVATLEALYEVQGIDIEVLPKEVLVKVISLVKSPNGLLAKSAVDVLTYQKALPEELQLYFLDALQHTFEEQDDLEVRFRKDIAIILSWQAALSEEVLRRLHVLLDSEAEEMRKVALYSLGGQRTFQPKTLSYISDALIDSSSRIQLAAIVSLTKMENLPDRLLKRVDSLLRIGGDQGLRVAALHLLSKQPQLSNSTLAFVMEKLDKEVYPNDTYAYDPWATQNYWREEPSEIIPADYSYFWDKDIVEELFQVIKSQNLSDSMRERLIGYLSSDIQALFRNNWFPSLALDALGTQSDLSQRHLNQLIQVFKGSKVDLYGPTAEVLAKQEELELSLVEGFYSYNNELPFYPFKEIISQMKWNAQVESQIWDYLEGGDQNKKDFALEVLSQKVRLTENNCARIFRLIERYDLGFPRALQEILSSSKDKSCLHEKLINGIKSKKVEFSTVSKVVRYLNLDSGFTRYKNELLDYLFTVLDTGTIARQTEVLEILSYFPNLEKKRLEQVLPFLSDTASILVESGFTVLSAQKALPDSYLDEVLSVLKNPPPEFYPNLSEEFIRINGLKEERLDAFASLLTLPNADAKYVALQVFLNHPRLSENVIKAIVSLLLKEPEFSYLIPKVLFNQEVLPEAVLNDLYPIAINKMPLDFYKWLNRQSMARGQSVYPWYRAMPFILQVASQKNEDKYVNDAFLFRIPLYTLSGGEDSIKYLLRWLCRPNFRPKRISIEEAQTTLGLIMRLELEEDDNLENFHRELGEALPRLIRSAEGGWSVGDLSHLKQSLEFLKRENPTEADYIQSLIQGLQSESWLYMLLNIWVAHLLFWGVVLMVYPYSPFIQQTLVWNPPVRKILGLGYIGQLIGWIPFLRRRLFLPFSKQLTTDAFPNNWEGSEYFPNSQVYATGERKSLPVMEALFPLNGQVVLEGESGLGKTMLLRNLINRSSTTTAFLPAARCTEGIIPAIQQKLPLLERDKPFLERLIYAGSMDLFIDGLNEISAQACAKLSDEVERYIKGNLLLTTQPMEWSPPASARLYTLKPLSEAHIEEFLLTRYSFLDQHELIPESAYKERCREYLKQAFDSKLGSQSLKAHKHILSNPMDLVLVAQLIARGENPSLLDLQTQQYKLMAESYERNNMRNPFPLDRFSTEVYHMRCEDRTEIPIESSMAAIQAMERWKMVVSRQTLDSHVNETVERWYFRHDKIMDFFLVQEFMDREELWENHLDDPRFRGVYFLLAYKLDYHTAMLLRERLIQHAADSKDHSLSDNFVQILRSRKKPKKVSSRELKSEIQQAIIEGDAQRALQLIKKRAKGVKASELVLLESQEIALGQQIRENTISSEEAERRRNQLNKSILDLIELF